MLQPFSSWLFLRENNQQLSDMKNQWDFLHKNIGLPIKYRINWPDSKTAAQIGYPMPADIAAVANSRGFINTQKLPYFSGYKGYPTPLPSRENGTPVYKDGWVTFVGQDELYRSGGAVSMPINEAKPYVLKAMQVLGLQPQDLQKYFFPPEFIQTLGSSGQTTDNQAKIFTISVVGVSAKEIFQALSGALKATCDVTVKDGRINITKR